MLIAYKEKKFRDRSLKLIAVCNSIIAEFKSSGYNPTLRQIYYQLVGRDLFPDDRKFKWTGKAWVRHPQGTKNATPNYDMLGELLNEARLCGLTDWDDMVDGTRSLMALDHWRDAAHAVSDAGRRFNVDCWEGQPNRVEVWVEKDAVEEIAGRAATEYDCPFFSCRGYTSQSSMHGAAMRMLGYFQDDGASRVIVLHVGDHDPSGVDMTRDIQDRLATFCQHHGYPAPEINRLALNMDQVRELNLPPNPAKMTDCRVGKYIEQFGEESWELDALPHKYLHDLISNAIEPLIEDEELFKQNRERERVARIELANIARNYDKVIKFLNKPQRKKK